MQNENAKNLLMFLLMRSHLTAPLKPPIQISYEEKISLSTPIFSPFGPLPKSISEYVEKRKGHQFKPHVTYFVEKEGSIFLVQEISGSQESLRQQLASFWALAQRCHQMFKEIALEELFCQKACS